MSFKPQVTIKKLEELERDGNKILNLELEVNEGFAEWYEKTQGRPFNMEVFKVEFYAGIKNGLIDPSKFIKKDNKDEDKS